jgi:hypothetical protein
LSVKVDATIRAKRYDPETGWEDSVILGDVPSSGLILPTVAINTTENAVGVWHYGLFSGFNRIFASTFIKNDGWSLPLQLDDGLGTSGGPRVAMDRFGNAVAVWVQFNFLRTNIYANRYRHGPGGGWGNAVKIEDNQSNTSGFTTGATFPAIGMDDAGNAIVIWWLAYFPDRNIWSNRYEPGSGWGTPTPIGNGEEVRYPELAVNARGDATAVWLHVQGPNFFSIDVWASRFD